MDTLQIVAEPTRRRILELVWDGELQAGEIAEHFEVTFGAVSQHLRVLREAGLVNVRAEGNRRLYTADKDSLAPFRPLLEAMWSEHLKGLARSIEAEEA